MDVSGHASVHLLIRVSRVRSAGGPPFSQVSTALLAGTGVRKVRDSVWDQVAALLVHNLNLLVYV